MFITDTNGCDVDSEADEGTIDTENIMVGSTGLTSLGIAALKANENVTHRLKFSDEDLIDPLGQYRNDLKLKEDAKFLFKENEKSLLKRKVSGSSDEKKFSLLKLPSELNTFLSKEDNCSVVI